MVTLRGLPYARAPSHMAHTRTGVDPHPDTGSRAGLHLAQMTCPQARQWWRLRRTVKRWSQEWQVRAWASGTQGARSDGSSTAPAHFPRRARAGSSSPCAHRLWPSKVDMRPALR